MVFLGLLSTSCKFDAKKNDKDGYTITLSNNDSPISLKLRNEINDKKGSCFILVRHAEKVDSSKDPELTEAGKKRAERLSEILDDIKLDAIYSSDYLRTKFTAQPSADISDIEVKIYDPRDLDSFSGMLKTTHLNHNVLIVGHSNTTPSLINKLMDIEDFSSLSEDRYDDIFIVKFDGMSNVKVHELKYGE